jgi:type II secretory pathway component PulF
MADFYYEALEEHGQAISGRIRAMDVKDAIRQLEANRWDVVSVRTVPKPIEGLASRGEAPPREAPLGDKTEEPIDREMPRLSRKESAELAGHLANVMQAGLPLAGGLSALAEELPDGKVRRGIKAMVSQLESGRSLEAVLESRSVPADLRGLVKAGLRTGHTGEILSQYVHHAHRTQDLKRNIALAWGYPLILVLSALAIFVFFALYIVPQFRDIFSDFGIELPSLTESLIWLSDMIRNDWPLILAGLAGVAVAVWVFWRFFLTASQRRSVLWCLPLVGPMIRAAALARFSRVLGLLLENNVPLPEAFRLAGRAAGDAELSEAAMYLADVVETGRPLRGNEYACQRFPRTFVQLLSQIENQKPQRGAVKTLGDACASSAQMFESQARVAAARIAAICQPLIVIVTGGLVGYLVIALFMPLIRLLNDLS